VLLDLMANANLAGRAALGLNPISAKWHNLFFDDEVLIRFMQ